MRASEKATRIEWIFINSIRMDAGIEWHESCYQLGKPFVENAHLI